MPDLTIEWTPEMMTFIAEQWQSGATSAEIGKALGVSKNAVLGIIYRHSIVRYGPIPKLEVIPRKSQIKAEYEKSVWHMDEDERRIAFAKNASEGARKTLNMSFSHAKV